MESFSELNLHKTILINLKREGFEKPREIQKLCIPVALKNNDILALSPTASGKTIAFSLGIIQKLLNTSRDKAMIMSPTRELAGQIASVFNKLIVGTPIRSALLTGGSSIQKQIRQLGRNPRIIFLTPGRAWDLTQRRKLSLKDVTTVVLDEGDELINFGFLPQINRLIDLIPKNNKVQKLLFSATLPHSVVSLAERILNNPTKISVDPSLAPAKNIKLEVRFCKDGNKYSQLTTELYERKGGVIVFAKTRRSCDKLAKRLSYDGFSCEHISSNVRQNKRDRIIKKFRNKEFSILIGTDVLARGIDVPHVDTVINFDLPNNAEVFRHRVGRTSRNNDKGTAITIVSDNVKSDWNFIERQIDPNAKPGDFKNKKRRRKSFDRRGGRGKNRFNNRRIDFRSSKDKNEKNKDSRLYAFNPKRDDQKRSRSKKRYDRDRRDKNQREKENKSYSFKKKFGRNNKPFNKGFKNKYKRFSGKKKFRN
ncbi:MAG: DEAD/DEAH box helicase [Candidatus Pelagibacter sp.]